MKSNVLVSISGLHQTEEPEDVIEVVAPGRYYFKNGKHYILYTEFLDGNPKNEVKNTLKISDDYVDIIRKGALNHMHMFFQEGTDSSTHYNTEFGSIQVSMSTIKLDKTIADDMIKLLIQYTLSVDCVKVSDCTITINIKSIDDE